MAVGTTTILYLPVFDYCIGQRMRSSRILVWKMARVAVLSLLCGAGRNSGTLLQGAVAYGGMLSISG
jgi:hypothetical protein